MNSGSNQTTIGARIAMIRAHRLINQEGLAAAVWVSRNVISNIECNRTQITVELAEQIATALHCTFDDLLAPLDAPMARIRFRGRSKYSEAKRPFASSRPNKKKPRRSGAEVGLGGSQKPT